MNNKKSNVVCLNDVFNDVVNFVSNTISYGSTIGDSTTHYYNTDKFYYPQRIWQGFDWDYFNNYTFKCTADFIPSYPVSNYSIDKQGNSIIEIAVTGFKENELSIEKVDSKIIVRGKKEKKEEDKKYIYKNIACRDFELEFQGSDSWDYTKINAEIKDGMLIITIPVKEESRPFEIKINKK